MNGRVFVKSDKYFNDRDEFDMYQEMGMDVIPVDLNGAYVPEKKYDPQNLKRAQQTIQKRFGLEEVEKEVGSEEGY